MKLETMSFNKMRELQDYVNQEGISQDRIVSIFPNQDKTFTIVYYCNE